MRPATPEMPGAVDVVLRDGSTVQITPLRREDGPGLTGLMAGLSARSLRQRFSSAGLTIARFVEEEIDEVSPGHYALVARAGEDQHIVGHGCYHLDPDGWAEPAFLVADNYQGRGLGTILLGQLAEAAEARDIPAFRATVLPDNYQMLDVFRDSGFTLEVESQSGILAVRFPTSLNAEAVQRFTQREWTAAVSAVNSLLRPTSIAVIGASRERHKVGGQTFRNLLDFGFQGPVYPVNPTAPVVHSVLAYRDVQNIPGPIELAIVAVPAEQVQGAAEACGLKGVRALVVLSSNFGEVGPKGLERQRRLLDTCRRFGMRLVGPNCLGVVNTDPSVALNAMFTPTVPPAGNIAFASQSGALGLAAMDYAASIGLGISSFVSLGNKADISSNDLLCYWEQDEQTRVILLYLESFGNPRKFSAIARRVGRQKPIVVVKSGRSSVGARAASSHTGALLAASDVAVDALFRQAGVIRTDTLQELFAVASLLAYQPAPRGRRVGIVSNAGGPAILCADTCDAAGLQIPELGEQTQVGLRAFLPPQASTINPVDMIATATPDDYRSALSLVLRDPAVDAAVAIFIPPLQVTGADVARAIGEAAAGLDGTKPVLGVLMTSHELPAEGPSRIPHYAFPEDAAKALALAVRYGERLMRPAVEAARPGGLLRDRACALVAREMAGGPGWLSPGTVEDLFRCYGLPLVAQRLVPDAKAAGKAADELGGRVALKAVAPGLLHKTDAGAVLLGLEGAQAVRRAAVAMKRHVQAAGYSLEGFIVQQMVQEGAEMLVGVVNDPRFGPIIACGAGGVAVELLGDVQFRLAPLAPEDVGEMLRGLRTFPLLTGFRGRRPCDVAALEDLLDRISVLVQDLPQVAEMDCNPVVVMQEGAVIVDARVRLGPPPTRMPIGARG